MFGDAENFNSLTSENLILYFITSFIWLHTHNVNLVHKKSLLMNLNIGKKNWTFEKLRRIVKLRKKIKNL